jgi:Acetyltransferases
MTIEAISVDSNYQNKGIGTLLMEHILGVTRKYKCTDIDLTVNQENLTAINFYEKLGMKIKNIKYSTII